MRQQEPVEETRIWPTQKGLNSKIHLAVDAHGMPVRMLVTAGNVANCSQACELVEGIESENLLSDKGYDSDAFIDSLKKSKILFYSPI